MLGSSSQRPSHTEAVDTLVTVGVERVHSVENTPTACVVDISYGERVQSDALLAHIMSTERKIEVRVPIKWDCTLTVPKMVR